MTPPGPDAERGPAGGLATYEVEVGGHLDDHWSDWLGGTLSRNRDATTTITLEAVDQAGLHGVLAAIRDLGAPLLSLRALDRTAPTTSPAPGLGRAPG
jgi:hypothetical protein